MTQLLTFNRAKSSVKNALSNVKSPEWRASKSLTSGALAARPRSRGQPGSVHPRSTEAKVNQSLGIDTPGESVATAGEPDMSLESR